MTNIDERIASNIKLAVSNLQTLLTEAADNNMTVNIDVNVDYKNLEQLKSTLHIRVKCSGLW